MPKSKRDIYVEKMKNELDDLNGKIDTLEAKVSEAKGDAHEKYTAEMAKLRKQSHLAKKKFEELKSASEDKWDAMVAEMDKLRDAVTHSFHYFKSQL